MIVAYFILIAIALFKLHRELEHYAELEKQDSDDESLQKMKSVKLWVLCWGVAAAGSCIAFVVDFLDLLQNTR